MRTLNWVECSNVAGGNNNNDVVYVAQVFPPPSPESKLVILMGMGAMIGGFAGVGIGTTVGVSGAGLVGAAIAGAIGGGLVFPVIGFSMANMISSGFDSIKSLYI